MSPLTARLTARLIARLIARSAAQPVRRLAVLAFATLAVGSAQAQTVLVNGTPRSFPVVINQPGHYVLNAPLHVPGPTHGIQINASNVVLDLGHQYIQGPVNCAMPCTPGTHSGVKIYGNNVTVRNGSIRAFSDSGVSFGNGVVVLEDLALTSNGRAGVSRLGLSATTDAVPVAPATLRRVVSMVNGQAGAFGYAMTIEQAIFTRNRGPGLVTQGMNTLIDSVVDANEGYGVESAGYVVGTDVTRGTRYYLNALDWASSSTTMRSAGGNRATPDIAF